MIMLSKFSNFPDELSENDKLREYELSGSNCILINSQHPKNIQGAVPYQTEDTRF